MTVARRSLLAASALTPQTKGVIDGYILDDWDQIICNIKNGKAPEYYQDGDWKELDSTKYGRTIVYLTIGNVTGYLDEAKTQKASVQWQTRYRFPVPFSVCENTNKSWPDSDIGKFFNETLLNTFPTSVKEAIIPCYVRMTASYQSDITKYSKIFPAHDTGMIWQHLANSIVVYEAHIPSRPDNVPYAYTVYFYIGNLQMNYFNGNSASSQNITIGKTYECYNHFYFYM